MEEEDEEKSNLEEEYLDPAEEMDMQEIDRHGYGEFFLTNISKEDIQILQKEILKDKSKIGSST
jgi:hypothetical protein